MPTICLSGSVVNRVGPNATVFPDATYNQYIDAAEGDVVAETRVDWVTDWPTLSGSSGAGAVEAAVCSKAAIKVVSYDPDAIGRSTTGFMVNVLWAEYARAIRELKESKTVTALGASYIGT